MAITITPTKTFVTGDHLEQVVTVALDNSYPTGGYPLTGAQLGCETRLTAVIPTAPTSGHTLAYDYVNGKLMVFTAGTQVANAVDLSAVTGIRLVVQGKGSAVRA